MLYTNPLDAARNYHADRPKTTVKSTEVNGVTAVDKNVLCFKDGSVKFQENVPLTVRKQFLKNGTGNILKKYFTEVTFDTAKNEVTISALKIPNIIKMFKIFAGERINPIVHTFEYSRASDTIYRNFMNFIGKIK